MYIRKLATLLLSASLSIAGLGAFSSKTETAFEPISVSAETTVKMGIDVSYYQGEIDWTKVKNEVDFVMIRLGFTGSVSYTSAMDEKFTEYVAGAKAAGIPMGVYYYSYAKTAEKAAEEAAWCVNVLKDYSATFSYPIAFDLEDTVTQSVAAEAGKAFCDVLRDNGYYPIIYSSTNWYNNIISPMSTISEVDFWQANYYTSYAGQTISALSAKAGNRPSISSYDSNVKMWQCTDGGIVSGIDGGVDTDICYFDYETLIKSEGYNGHMATAATARHAVCTGTTVNIRSGASTAYSTLGQATYGQEFTLKKIYNSNWLEIEYAGQTAYVHASYFSVLDGEAENDDVGASNTQTVQYAVCTGTGVNIRQEPNTDCTVLGSTNVGDEFLLLGVYSDEWLQIEYEGQTAYIYAQYATIRTDTVTNEPDEEEDSSDSETSEDSSDNSGSSENEEDPENSGGSDSTDSTDSTGSADSSNSTDSSESEKGEASEENENTFFDDVKLTLTNGCASSAGIYAAVAFAGVAGLLCVSKKKKE